MKKILFAVIALGMAMIANAQNIDYSRDVRFRMGNSFPVKGGVGIEQFYMALMPGVSTYFKDNNITSIDQDEEGEYIVDKKNGYLSHFAEGSGSLRMQCCYWNRADGSKLVGFYYDAHDFDGQAIKYNSFAQFYTYNETSKCLDAINKPWDIEMSGMTHVMFQLPRQGKDVQYRWGLEEEDGKWSTLTWNGYDFRTKPAAGGSIKTGSHLISLQWIEGVQYGSCQIKPAGNGKYTISGTHYNKAKTDWLKIDGTLTVVNSKRLRFSGTIKTRISHIAGGVEQVRRGEYDFLATGSRKYWRLQQMYNPGEGCVDYVDIYF